MYLLFCEPAGDGGQDWRWRPEADPLKSARFNLKGQRLIAFKCGGVSCIEREANGGNSKGASAALFKTAQQSAGSSRKKKTDELFTGSVAHLILFHCT